MGIIYEPVYKKAGVAITSARYEDGVPFHETRQKAVDNIRKQISEVNSVVVPEEFVLVLWENIPREKTLKNLGHSNSLLLDRFLDMAEYRAEEPVIFIKSPKCLGETAEEIIDNVSIIKKHLGVECRTPMFLEDHFLSRWKYGQEFQTILNASGLVDVLRGGKMEIIPDSFIQEYFNWQAGKKEATECVEALRDTDSLSVPSFYRQAGVFEENPVYLEYLRAYSNFLEHTARRGNAPDAIDFLHAYNEMESDRKRSQKLFKMFPEILDVTDVERVKILADKRIALLKRKGQFKKAIKAHGLEKL